MKYFNLLFVFIFFLSFSFLEGMNFSKKISQFQNQISSFSQKKFFQINNYGKNLKTDMKNFQCSRQGIKQFASLHPWLAAKASQEVFGFLSFVFPPMLYCSSPECKKTPFQHFRDQTKYYLYENYIDFFNFIFKFDKNLYDLTNFFSVEPKGNKRSFFFYCTRFISFPILTSLTKIYALLRTKPTQPDKTIEGEDYGEALQKLFTV